MSEWFQRQWEILTGMSDDRLPLLDGALLIARDEYPELNIGALAAEVHAIAHALVGRLGGERSVQVRLEAMHQLLFAEMGFCGNQDDYYDPRNSYLNDVLLRRTGIPISLAVIYIEVGRLLGLDLRGVGFPGHFLVRLDSEQGLQLLDPFNGGDSVTLEQLRARLEALPALGSERIPSRLDHLLDPSSNREILVRMLRNLKAIYLGSQDNHRALRCTDRIVMLLPEHAPEYRDRGTLYLTLGAQHAALQDLRRYLQLMPDCEDATEVQAQIRDLSIHDHTLH